jgi:hypothetical protein
MKIDECEQAIRHLALEWFNTLPPEEHEHPSWYAFKIWLSDKHYSRYLNFRSPKASADYIAEMWFDDALGHNWRR